MPLKTGLVHCRRRTDLQTDPVRMEKVKGENSSIYRTRYRWRLISGNMVDNFSGIRIVSLLKVYSSFWYAESLFLAIEDWYPLASALQINFIRTNPLQDFWCQLEGGMKFVLPKLFTNPNAVQRWETWLCIWNRYMPFKRRGRTATGEVF